MLLLLLPLLLLLTYQHLASLRYVFGGRDDREYLNDVWSWTGDDADTWVKDFSPSTLHRFYIDGDANVTHLVNSVSRLVENRECAWWPGWAWDVVRPLLPTDVSRAGGG